MFWRYRKKKVARESEWKLLIDDKDTSLYNLKNDIRETKDVSDVYFEIKKDLINKLTVWESEVDTPSKINRME